MRTLENFVVRDDLVARLYMSTSSTTYIELVLVDDGPLIIELSSSESAPLVVCGRFWDQIVLTLDGVTRKYLDEINSMLWKLVVKRFEQFQNTRPVLFSEILKLPALNCCFQWMDENGGVFGGDTCLVGTRIIPRVKIQGYRIVEQKILLNMKALEVMTVPHCPPPETKPIGRSTNFSDMVFRF
jgi:hypothetical protein